MTDVKTKRRQDAEASSLSRIGTRILRGNRLGVKWLPDNSGELGYTSDAKIVNIAWYEERFMSELSDTEQSMLRMGVFAHELLHQCLTNFRYTHYLIESMSRAEAGIFMKFANTLEDPAIEYFAPNIFGGRMLDALRFSIKHIYKISPGIEHSSNAFSQLINALINFGDMGLIKGKFTYPEAFKYFQEIAGLYNKGITCPDSKKRLDIARECMEITRPLWEEEAKKQEFIDELLDKLSKMLSSMNGIHLMDEEEDGMELPTDTPAAERRNAVVKRLSEKSENPDKSEASDDLDESNEPNNMSSEDGAENENDNSDTSSDSQSGKSNSTSSQDDSSSSSSSNAESESSNTSDASDTTNNTPNVSGGNNDDITASEYDANRAADDTYTIDETELEALEQSIKAEEKALERKESSKNDDSSISDSKLPDFDITSSSIKQGTTCNNMRVANMTGRGLGNLYNELVQESAWEIKTLAKTLSKIFKSDQEEYHRTTSGGYNILRGSVGTTARIFDKRRDPGNLKDTQVMLAVDLSGSMCGPKIQSARRAAITFAESLTKVGVPYYIMGYSADQFAQADHIHFVDWNNKKNDRESLATMQANGNNFDGYSIRYAANLLKERNTSNKILFVISDGEPCCASYRSMPAGISDTTLAIKEARKFCTVFGIALGTGCSPKTLQKMYGKDFIWCKDERLLTNILCKKLEKVLAKK